MTAGRLFRRPTRPLLQVEQLETRVMPTAVLVDDFRVRYLDLDNDIVTIKASKPIFTSQAAASAILTFTNASNVDIVSPFTGGLTSNPAYVRTIDLNSVGTMRLSLQVVVTGKALGGDGLAEVGLIDSSTNPDCDLRRVIVGGRLFEIDTAGEVRSLTTTYLGTGDISPLSLGAADFAGSTSISNIGGDIRQFRVVKNIDNGFLDVAGQIRRSIIQGDIGVDPTIGGTSSDDDTSAVHAMSLGKFELRGNLYGGSGLRSGSIRADSIGSVAVMKDMLGGDGNFSGWIRSESTMLAAGVGGNLAGGMGDDSGEISVDGHIGAAFVQDDIAGGSGLNSGSVRSDNDGLDLMRVGGSIVGGDGNNSGSVTVASVLTDVLITHNVVGGTGTNSGFVGGDVLTRVLIQGSVMGGGSTVSVDGLNSGNIMAGSVMTLVKVSGDVVGGLGDESGNIHSGATIGKATVIGNVAGGAGVGSGAITSIDVMTSAFVNGDIVGGPGSASGAIAATTDIGSVTVRGAVRGGAGPASGAIHADGNITGTIRVNQSVVGMGEDAGVISASGNINKIDVKMDLDAGFIVATGTIESVTVRNILGGTPSGSGSIETGDTIGNVSVLDSVVAGLGDNTGVIHSAADLTRVNIGKNLDGTGRLQLSGSVQVGPGSAMVAADGDIGYLKVHGQVRGGNNDNTGAIFADADGSGAGDIGTLILSDIAGGSSYGGHSVFGQTVTNTGYVQAVNLDTVTVSGGMLSGVNLGAELFNSASIRVLDTLGVASIDGGFRGNLDSRPTISAMNEIVSLTFNSQVENAEILVGYSPDIYATYESNGELDGNGNVIYGPHLLNIVNGIAMDASDPTQFNDSAVLDTLTANRSWGETNLVVSVDPVDGLLGNSDDDTRTGTIGTVKFNGVIGYGFARHDLTYVIAAATMSNLSGSGLGASPTKFTQADATTIGVGAFNVLTHANVDFATDRDFLLLYK